MMETLFQTHGEPGRLICFEGIDGSGKSTVSRLLVEELRCRGVDAELLTTKAIRPDDAFAARQLTVLKDALWDYPVDGNLSVMGDRHWLCLIAAWFHALDASTIRPALGRGRTVVVDGWIYKFAARFALKPGLGEASALRAFEGLVKPDATIFLDVPPELTALRRAEFKPSEMGRFDGQKGDAKAAYVAYQSRVRERYQGWSARLGWHCAVLADEPAEKVTEVVSHMIVGKMAA
ncbi:MAG TPA: dTMP kinase [Magnetospirillum sp.]|nr:dTMP kinase [Magnetospirillum sp.]